MKKRAVFLDRDGVIIEDVPDMCKMEDIDIISSSARAVKILNELQLLVIIATNQPQIAKGFCTEVLVKAINAKIVDELKKEGARIDAIYYCPHHPEKGFSGERPEYKVECTCRKPKIGMLEQAMERFDIDMAKSFMAGNTTRDVETGKNASGKYPGFRTILISEPDKDKEKSAAREYLIADDLLGAARLIKGIVEKEQWHGL